MKWLIWNRALYALAAFIALPYRWLGYRRMIYIATEGDAYPIDEENRQRCWPR